LHRHIAACSQYHDELKELQWKSPDISDEALIGYCNFLCAAYLYFFNGFNIIRMDMKDFESAKGRDWLRPFLTSMLIWSEETYRQKIGLLRLLPHDLDALRHSTFMQMVRDGHNNPLFEWKSHYGLVHSQVS
jgi:hypothetical protein